MIQNGLTNVSVLTVTDLYEEFERMDVPDYYEPGEVNPYLGRTKVIPRKATFYIMVPQNEERALMLARATLRGLSRRKKVREAVCTKAEINFNQFAKAGNIVVLYV